MTLDEATRRLKHHEVELRRLGVEGLFIFGSVARGEEGPSSDVDLFFDYRRGELGLYELIDVKDYTAKVLGRPTDIMTRDSIHRRLRPDIERSAIRVF